MRTKVPIKKAVHRADGTAGNNKLHKKAYREVTAMSSNNLKDEIGLLLWFLCSPLSEKQCTAGYRLLEILLSARYEQGAL